MSTEKNYEMDECLLENRQIIQVHSGQQARLLDWPAKQVSEESHHDGYAYGVPSDTFVWDGSQVREGGMAWPV